MGEAAKKILYTVEEYLEIEQNSLERYTYHSGEIFAMAGGTLNHSLLASNISRGMGNSLINKGKPCRIYNSDAKIAVSDEDFVYADAFVVCGKTETYPTNKHAAQNPVLIVEVLSNSTALFDREEKFQSYRYIKSFREYVLISQDKVLVEVFYKPERVAFWQYRAYNDLNETIELKSIDVQISLQDIYLDVVF
jgi:Uma2 family endonuclease